MAGTNSTETTESSDKEPVRTDDRESGRSGHDATDGGNHLSSRQVRINTLQAEVELLEAERDTLSEEVTVLESAVGNLEREVTALERTIESADIERQQLINQYEHVIAEKERAYDELQQELDEATSDRTFSPLSGLVQRVTRKIPWLKRSNRDP
jgi:chromosome segregation ATPase